jgi:hypothetical protein
MTLVQFFVNFLRPYADLPEFAICIMRAMKELGHSTHQVPACGWKSKDPAKFKAHDVDCNE